MPRQKSFRPATSLTDRADQKKGEGGEECLVEMKWTKTYLQGSTPIVTTTRIYDREIQLSVLFLRSGKKEVVGAARQREAYGGRVDHKKE